MKSVTGGATNVTTYFAMRLAADGTEATGLTVTNFDLQYTRNNTAPTAKVDATAGSLTAHSDNTVVEVDATDQPGLYKIDWPDAAFAAGVLDVTLSAKCATCFTEHMTVEIDKEVSVIEWNGVKLSVTNPLPNAAAEAAGGLIVSTLGTTDADDCLTATGFALASVVGSLADAASDGDPTSADTVMQYLKQLINVLVGTAGVGTYPAEAAPGNGVSLAEVIRAVHADVTGLNGDVMRGTDNAALASVVGALTDAAASGDPTVSDTLVQYTKQLINVLIGSAGITTWPASAAPGNAVSIAEALRAVYDDSNDLQINQGNWLTVSGLNDLSTADIDTRLAAIGLDHLVSAAVIGTDVADNSIFARLVSASATADWDDFANTTDSLQALRDRGDAAWITGGGGGLTQILNVVPKIPALIDLANTATMRIGLALVNSLDDLPTTAEITPGTLSIDRKALGGTTWSSIVADSALTEQAGAVYLDEVFDSGTGYAEGDILRFTFKSISITADTNTHEVCDATGIIFYSAINQTMRGTDSAALASVATEARLAELDAANLPADIDLILADTGTDGVVLSAAQMNAIADHTWRRTAANIRASSDGDAVIFRSGLGAMSKLVNQVGVNGTNLEIKEEDDTTNFGVQAITTDAAAEPITVLNTT